LVVAQVAEVAEEEEEEEDVSKEVAAEEPLASFRHQQLPEECKFQ
jgi:hypothetical protein